MILLRESAKLSVKKFTTKKVRSFFAGFTISLGIIIILTVIVATSAVSIFFTNNFKDSFVDNAYLSFPITYCETSNITKTEVCKGDEIDKQLEEFKDYKIISKHQSDQLNSLRFSFTEFEHATGNSLTTSDSFLIQDFLYDDYTFEDKYDGAIPVIIPKKYMTTNLYDSKGMSEKEIYEKDTEILNNYLGKKIRLNSLGKQGGSVRINGGNPIVEELSEEDSDFKEYNVELIIVGYSSIDFAFDFVSSTVMTSMVIPNWAIEKNTDLKSLFDTKTLSYYFVEFENAKIRDEFIDKKYTDALRGGQTFPELYPMQSRYLPIQLILNVARGVGFAAGGFLLIISALFILNTIGKIIDDSRKEIGVFRAFGATKNDVRLIYYGYSFIIVNAGFFIGLILSYTLNIILSLIYGDKLFYSLIGLGNSLDLAKPALFFINFPFKEILIVYAILVVIGLAASFIPVQRAARLDPIKVLRDE